MDFSTRCMSNTFEVKDPEAFEESMDLIKEVELEREGDKVKLFIENGFPEFIWDDDSDDYVECNFKKLIQEHLKDVPNNVAVFTESGYQGYDSNFAYATIITPTEVEVLDFFKIIVPEIIKDKYLSGT